MNAGTSQICLKESELLSKYIQLLNPPTHLTSISFVQNNENSITITNTQINVLIH